MRSPALLFVVALLAGFGWLAHGCSTPCTLVWYAEGFHLVLMRPSWELADYRFEGTFDGEPFSCALDTANLATCTPASVTIGAWNYDRVMMFSSNPRDVTVAVRRGDVLLGEGRFRPSYLRDEPNGEGCGERIFATETLELPGEPPCGVDDTCRCVFDDGCGCGSDHIPTSPWVAACPPGAVPETACDPAACGCPDSEPDFCYAGCDAASRAGQRAVCVEGAWACPDSRYPVNSRDCR